MRTRRIVTLGVFGVLLICAGAAVLFMGDMGVRLKVSVPGRVYLQGEPVPVTVTVWNGTPCRFDQAGGADELWGAFRIVVRYEDGTVVPDPGLVLEPYERGSRRGHGFVEPWSSEKLQVDLNAVALIGEPGRYSIQAVFTVDRVAWSDDVPMVDSRVVEIVVKRRSDEDMQRYVETLSDKIVKLGGDDEKREDLGWRLLYTRDPAMMGALLEVGRKDAAERKAALDRGLLTIDGGGYEISCALMAYLPLGERTRVAAVAAAKEMGVADGLVRFGYGPEELARWAEEGFPQVRESFLLVADLAQCYPSDLLTSAMAGYVLDGDTDEYLRSYAIDQLPYNRTDEAVAALERLANDNSQVIRNAAVRAAARARELMLDHKRELEEKVGDDAHERQLLAAAVTDAKRLDRWRLFEQAIEHLEPNDVDVLLGVISGDGSAIAQAEKENLTRAVSAVLRDGHKDVHDMAVTLIRIHAMRSRRTYFREEDLEGKLRRLVGNER